MTKIKNKAQPSSGSKPNGVRPSLSMGLGLVCLAAWWALGADDDSARSTNNAEGGRAARSGQSEVAWKRAVVSDSAPQAIDVKNEGVEALSLDAQTLSWRTRGNLGAVNTMAKAAWGSKVPPPPPVVLPPPPPPPPPAVAPTFPYQVVGRWQERNVASLTENIEGQSAKGAKTVDWIVVVGVNNTWVLKPGDVIEGSWRVEEISERNLRLTYLPLQQSQIISITTS